MHPGYYNKSNPRYFIENDTKTEAVKGYRMLFETMQLPFTNSHYSWFLKNAASVQFFNA